MSDLVQFFTPLQEIMHCAGEAILKVYSASQPILVDSKSDNSPVTQADYAAHDIIDAGLKQLTGNYAILSEEGGMPPFNERATWKRYWLVDPLDGTKEFINRNGEFTVNIALIEQGIPVLGAVYVPVKKILYIGGPGLGSRKICDISDSEIISKPLDFGQDLRVVGSRRHGAEELDQLIETISPRFNHVELVSMGSSLKICACAEGSADWYPRLALTSEWDTAAAHAVLLGAGGEIYDTDLEPLRYNQKEDILNPFFHAVGDATFSWSKLINHK